MTLLTFFSRQTFTFIDPGPMIDGELELVEPAQHWFEDQLASCRHPLTVRDMPQHARMTWDGLVSFLRHHPRGRTRAEPARGISPAYSFWMRLRPECFPPGKRPIPMAGGISLRIGSDENIELYFGHLGYHVFPAARSNRYAQRACQLLFPLARAHGFRTLWITCNPENLPSRRTCENLGGALVDIVPVPKSNSLYEQGDREKCRYRVEI
jgi:tagatose 1,6-diphosphate aldolase